MKKLLLLTAIAGIAAIVAWKLFSGKETKPVEEKKDQPLTLINNSTAFDLAFSKLLGDYYAIRDALVDWDTAKADIAAEKLQKKADTISFRELKGDSAVILTAQNLATSISSEAKGLIGETDIEQKRRAFNMLTDEMYNIIRTVRYSAEMIYHIKCPMAFKDSEEAYWLSNTIKIVNPYLGTKHPIYKDKMVGCGQVIDSLDFAKK